MIALVLYGQDDRHGVGGPGADLACARGSEVGRFALASEGLGDGAAELGLVDLERGNFGDG